jgi:hypothetical protein
MSITNDDKNAPHKMIKRVQTKEDGRMLIYYTFEDSDRSRDGDNELEASDKKEVKQ